MQDAQSQLADAIQTVLPHATVLVSEAASALVERHNLSSWVRDFEGIYYSLPIQVRVCVCVGPYK